MIPLYDETTKNSPPFLTTLLIALNIIVFLITFPNLEEIVYKFGFVPKDFFQKKSFFPLFSSLFLHGSLWHLIGNMWYLWIFGGKIEKTFKKFFYLIFYFLCGIVSTLTFAIFSSQKNLPLIGASGAISGILGAYARFFSKNKIRCLNFFGFFWGIISLPAGVFLFLWLLYQFLLSFFQILPQIATLAHIGGFLCGFAFAKIFKKWSKFSLI
jgi:membrane associated rhomboid family serine protease